MKLFTVITVLALLQGSMAFATDISKVSSIKQEFCSALDQARAKAIQDGKASEVNTVQLGATECANSSITIEAYKLDASRMRTSAAKLVDEQGIIYDILLHPTKTLPIPGREPEFAQCSGNLTATGIVVTEICTFMSNDRP